MKRSKSGAQKRKEAATARDAVAKLPKMTDFFKITEQSRPGTSTERDEENYRVQEKEDYDDQHQSDCEFPENVSCHLPANTFNIKNNFNIKNKLNLNLPLSLMTHVNGLKVFLMLNDVI